MNEKIKSAKDKIEELILNALKHSIKATIELTGHDFVIGSFPYWAKDCEFADGVKPIINIVNATSPANGYVRAELEFNFELQKISCQQYGFILNSILHIKCNNETDHLIITHSEDLDYLNDIEIPFLYIDTEEDVVRAENLINDFEQLLFLHA